MVKYFGILSLVDPPDGYKIIKHLEVTGADVDEVWKKAEKYQKDNNISGVLFSIHNKQAASSMLEATA